jgi:hypothetical protein
MNSQMQVRANNINKRALGLNETWTLSCSMTQTLTRNIVAAQRGWIPEVSLKNRLNHLSNAIRWIEKQMIVMIGNSITVLWSIRRR